MEHLGIQSLSEITAANKLYNRYIYHRLGIPVSPLLYAGASRVFEGFNVPIYNSTEFAAVAMANLDRGWVLKPLGCDGGRNILVMDRREWVKSNWTLDRLLVKTGLMVQTDHWCAHTYNEMGQDTVVGFPPYGEFTISVPLVDTSHILQVSCLCQSMKQHLAVVQWPSLATVNLVKRNLKAARAKHSAFHWN